MDVKFKTSQVRNRAVGLLLADITQNNVAKRVGKYIRTIKRWWLKHKKGESLEHRPGAGRPKKLSRISKITIAKSLGKRGQSTRSLAKRIPAMGNPVSKDTIHRHLTSTILSKAYKSPKHPKLKKKNRLNICLWKENWSIEDWKSIL